jgi:hypothetical protein
LLEEVTVLNIVVELAQILALVLFQISAPTIQNGDHVPNLFVGFVSKTVAISADHGAMQFHAFGWLVMVD